MDYDEAYYWDDWTGFGYEPFYSTAVEDEIGQNSSNSGASDDDLNWEAIGDGMWLNTETGEFQDDYGVSYGFQDIPDANSDENWIDLGDGSYVNEITGEIQDFDGNTIGYFQSGNGEVPLFADDDTGLQPRDNFLGTTDYIPPIDMPVSNGGGFLDSIGNFFSNIFGGGQASDPGRGSAGSGAGSGGGSFGGGSSGTGSQGGSQQQNQQAQQYQQAINQLQQQLAAAQRANANSNVTDALRAQIAQLQGGGSSGMTQTLLIAGGVGLAVYFATRNRQAA